MAIWDTLISAASGIGRLVAKNAGDEDAKRKITFTIGVIALSAKMAKADGQVTIDEVEAFHAICDFPDREMNNVARVYNMAKRDTAGFEVYARQVARLFQKGSVILEELVDALFFIAKADGEVHPSELDFLKKVADAFGLKRAVFDQLKARHMGQASASPYELLGVDPDISPDALRARHRALIKEHHPDRLTAQGLPAEFIKLANDRLAVINAAYDHILAERTFS